MSDTSRVWQLDACRGTGQGPVKETKHVSQGMRSYGGGEHSTPVVGPPLLVVCGDNIQSPPLHQQKIFPLCCLSRVSPSLSNEPH